jgi:uncharacterized protein YwqG
MLWWLLLIAAAAYLLWRRHRARQRQAGGRSAPALDPPRDFGRRSAPPPQQQMVTETVSVVLRRQVPPRDEAPRSWLGGLPMMPDDVPWPRSVSAEHPERGERPLHFVAQVACADFPPDLWGGLGPREGWLLFFVDPNQGVPEGSDAFAVLYVDALGVERPAPADLGPVYDGVYTGPSYDYCRAGEVPSVWRRWPVDLVTVPNTLRAVGQRRVAAPEDFAAQLYPGQPVAAERSRPAEPKPFTWRGALYMLNSLERSFAARLDTFRIHESVMARIRAPGLRDTVLAMLDAQEAQRMERQRAFLEGPEPAEEKERARRQAMIAHARDRAREREAIAAILAAHPTADSLLDYFRSTHEARGRWHEAARARIAAERDAVLDRDLDTLIDPAAWQAIQDRLQQDRYTAFTHDSIDWNGSRHFTLREIVSRITFGRRAGGDELLADYYVDPARRGLIPAELLAVYEPYWRRLEDNMPHRIGGYHDGVQSDAVPGPAKELLLFQIVSDPAMNWCWGDVGAYYVFIAPDDYERGDLSKATMSLECH